MTCKQKRRNCLMLYFYGPFSKCSSNRVSSRNQNTRNLREIRVPISQTKNCLLGFICHPKGRNGLEILYFVINVHGIFKKETIVFKKVCIYKRTMW